MICSIGVLNLKLSQFFAGQILGSLNFLKSKNLVHRDLKPANIVLNEKFQLILTDFGTAKSMISSGSSISSVSHVSGLSNISNIDVSQRDANHLSRNVSSQGSGDASLDELVGSEFFISPEMLISRQWSYASDIWALGVMIYQFVTG